MKKFYISGNSAMRIPINSTGEAANSQKDGSVGAARWGGVCGIVPGKRIGRSRSAVPGRERRFSEGGAGRGRGGAATRKRCHLTCIINICIYICTCVFNNRNASTRP